MRIPKPHWKKSHKCWYVKLKGEFHRLDPDQDKAFKLYADLLGRQNVKDGGAAAKHLTVRELLDAYLDWCQRHRAAETYLWYRKYIIGTNSKTGKYREAGFANYLRAGMLMRDLKPYHLENWLDARYPHADDDTKAGAITAILRAMNWGLEKGYIDENPLARVKKPQREGRGEFAYLNPAQWDRLVETVKDGQKGFEVEPFLDYLTVMRETGCRPQEIRKVEARHLDHEHRQWVFARKESKGKKESRAVLLGEAAYEICRRRARLFPDGPIFRNADGQPWTNSAIACRYRRLSEKLGFKVFAYAIRHTFATEAIINGADVITVARLMGHKDLTMLNRVYEHITKDRAHMEQMRQRATNRIAG